MEEVQEFIKMHYPDMENDKIASQTGISIHQVRRIATKWGLRKSKEFLDIKREKVENHSRSIFKNVSSNCLQQRNKWRSSMEAY
ncbi:hypothetical protein [Brevibacillus reuszeri]|uniref:hypothetical protein n=1 Tax=Brevibacillus reuszeri TaxID=54915 RepID=UPI000CCC8CF5|nr:hypothetical protein [Brevibacillus reuszeri]